MSGILTQFTTGDQVQLKAPERWVIERTFRCVAEANSTVPYTALLLDRQYYLAQGQNCVRHIRHVRQVHQNEAKSALSQINIPFAPHRESLTIHWIRIWRAGEKLNQLDAAEQITVKEGKTPNRLVAHLTLSELRKDDSLDVAYSLQAHTPTPRFSVVHPTNQRVPVLDWSLSVVAPPDITLLSQRARAPMQPVVRPLSGGSQFYQWQLRDLEMSERSENMPRWYRPTAEFQLTSTDSWPQIAAAVHKQWQIPALGLIGEEFAKGFLEPAGGDLWEAAREASRFVQNSITTLPPRALIRSAVEAGDTVLENLAGDAKAKACLLVQLLRAFGIPAAPLLVSRVRQKTITSMLPAADLFDHVIVRGRFEEQDFWIDPSAKHQAGPIQVNTLPAYGVGLQVSPRTKNLCAIPQPDPKQNVSMISEHFVIEADGKTSLKVTTRTIGRDANRLRKQVAEVSIEKFAQIRLANLNNRYANSTRSAEIAITDDAAKNEITLNEQFELPQIRSGEQGIARFSPIEIRRQLPTNLSRGDAPVALEFPCNIRHITVVDTPWPVAAAESSGNSPGTAFTCTYQHSASDRRHTLRYAYSALDDHILPTDFASVQMRLESLRPNLDYRFVPPAVAGEVKAKSGKGTRIIKKKQNPTETLRQRKIGSSAGSNWFLPIASCIAAFALVVGVRASFKNKAVETSTILKEERVAEEQAKAKAEEEAIAKYQIPDDLNDLTPPLQPISDGSELE